MAESGATRTRANRTNEAEASKAELQKEMEQTRESLAETVETIKDTVNDQYETVKETVSGVFDFRELFKQEPLLWSLGSLSAGFALGYTMGYAQKGTKGGKGKESQVTAFANSLVEEFSTVGKSLVMPTLNVKIKELFGFDFSDLLEEIDGANKKTQKRIGPRKAGGTKKASKASKARKRKTH